MVIVTFNVADDDKESKDEVNFPEADNFGISNTGDLILVKISQVQGGMGQPPQLIGNNIYAFAVGTWVSAKVEASTIQTMPSGVVMTPTPGQGR